MFLKDSCIVDDQGRQWFVYRQGMTFRDMPWRLKYVLVDENVTKMEANAFNNRSGKYSQLKAVKLSKNVVTIGNGAFNFCRNLDSVDVPNDSRLESIGSNSFQGCACRNISLPASLKSIGSYAFGNSKLERVTFQGDDHGLSRLTTIDTGAFICCKELEHVDLDHCALLKVLAVYTFSDCSSLESITLPPHLEEISFAVFARCRALKQITFPKSLRSIEFQPVDSTFGYPKTFGDCSSLTTITFQSLDTITKGELLRILPFHEGCTSLRNIQFSETALPNQMWPFIMKRLFMDDRSGLLGPNCTQGQRLNCLYSFLRTRLEGSSLVELLQGDNNRRPVVDDGHVALDVSTRDGADTTNETNESSTGCSIM